MTPGTSSHRVVVLNLFAGDLIPLRALRVEVVNVEAVEVTNDAGFTSGVESGACKFLDFLVLRVVKALETISGRLIKRDPTVITAGNDVGTPSESVRDCWVVDLLLGFGVKVEGDKGVV